MYHAECPIERVWQDTPTLLTEPSEAEPFPLLLCGDSQGRFYHFGDYNSQPGV
jgi:hypothetical protein